MLTPEDRILRARMAAHASWAATPDPSARTAAGRRAFGDRFDRQVDPDGVLAPEERARRSASAKASYFAGLALKSSTARRKAAAHRKSASVIEAEAAQADAELAENDEARSA